MTHIRCASRFPLLSTLIVGMLLATSLQARADGSSSTSSTPTDVDLFRSADNSIVFQLTNASLTGGTALDANGNKSFSGSGTLKVYIGGLNFPGIPGVPIQNLAIEPATGKVKGFDFIAQKKLDYGDFLGTGLKLSIPQSAQVSLIQGSGLIITTAQVTLPFKNSDGTPVVLNLKTPSGKTSGTKTDPALQIQQDGTLAIDASAPNIAIALPGFIFKGQNPELKLTHSPTQASYDDYTLSADTVEIDAPIPGVLASRRSSDSSAASAGAAAAAGAAAGGAAGASGVSDVPPLHLTVTKASFNSDGQFTFTNATLAAPDASGHVLVDLPHLGGFYLDVTKAHLTMDKNTVTAFDMTFDAHLPDDFTADAEGTKPCVLSNLYISINDPAKAQMGLIASYPAPTGSGAGTGNGGGTSSGGTKKGSIAGSGVIANSGTVTSANKASGLSIYWNRFGVQADTAILDLSADSDPNEKDENGVAYGKDWQGLYLKNASLVLPDEFTQNGSDQMKIAAKVASIDHQGFTGLIDVTSTAQGGVVANAQLDSFACALNTVHLRLDRDNIKECNVTGSLALADLDNKPINFGVGFTTAGNVNVALSTPQPITIDSLHVTAQITDGTFALDPSNNWKVKVSGSISAADGAPDWMDGLACRFKDLRFNSSGQIDFDPGGALWLTLPDTAEIPLGPVSVQLTEIGMGKDAAGTYSGREWLGFSGGVDITGLPLQLSTQFSGVKIYKPSGNSGVSFVMGGIDVDASLDGIFSLTGHLADSNSITHPDGTSLTVPAVVLDGKPMHLLTGGASVQLTSIGAGGGISLDFMVGKDCWFVMGGLQLPTPIPLGQTGVALYGFTGGVGYNVVAQPGIPMRDYIPKPDVNAIQNGNASLMFVAGVRVGQTPVPAIWGDLVLTVGLQDILGHNGGALPNILVSLDGGLSILNVPPGIPSQMPADFHTLDRVVTGGMSYDSSQDKFHAYLIADLNFPTRAKPLLSAYADCELNIQPGNTYFHVGDGLHYTGDSNPNLDLTNASVRKAALDSLAIDHPAQLKLYVPSTGSAVQIKVSPIQGIFDADFTNKKVRAAFIFDSSLDASGKVSSIVDINWSTHVSLSARGLLALDWGNDNDFHGTGAFRVIAQGKVKASAWHVNAELDASIEGDIAATFNTKPNPDFVIEGDLIASLSLHIPIYGEADFSISPHIRQEVSL